MIFDFLKDRIDLAGQRLFDYIKENKDIISLIDSSGTQVDMDLIKELIK